MPSTLLWFRHNLRLTDNRALQAAQMLGEPVVALYVFAPEWTQQPRRASFIYQCLQQLHYDLQQFGIPFYIVKGEVVSVVADWAQRLAATHVVAAESDAPAARAEENQLWHRLERTGQHLQLINDSVALARAEVMSSKGLPFSRFTPYKSAWFNTYPRFPSAQPQIVLPQTQRGLPMADLPTPEQLGFHLQNLMLAGGETAAQRHWQQFAEQMAMYHIHRDFPAKRSSSQLSTYLSTGVLSARVLIQHAFNAQNEGAQAWLVELIWREFYQQFLYHYPNTAQESYRPEYRQLAWHGSHADLQRWQQGQTGYPIVDAAMRALAQTGFIHHRLRMVVAEFLVKDLLIDWRAGAAWFAQQLLDYDPAANIGNWQRIAGTGGETLPISRSHNPVLQSQKYDPDGQFIRRFVPELAHLNNTIIHAPWLARESVHTNGYPAPVVVHSEQKAKVQAMFQAALKGEAV